MSSIDFNVALFVDRFEELIEACAVGEIGKVQKICSVRRHINEQNSNGWSPLIVATYNNHKDIVEYLIANGADIYAKNRNGTNLLMYAKEAYKKYNDNSLFKLFIQLGLSPKTKDYEGHDLAYYLNEEGIETSELYS